MKHKLNNLTESISDFRYLKALFLMQSHADILHDETFF